MAILMKAGDTAPAVQATLYDAGNVPVNLTGATVRFIMATKTAPRTVAVDAEAALVAPMAGEVVYEWAAGDTDEPGAYDVEFEVTYADGTVQTFPTEGYLDCTIEDDLGGTV